VGDFLGPVSDFLDRISAGAPASALLLATFAVVSLIGLYARPALIERNLLRPYGLAQFALMEAIFPPEHAMSTPLRPSGSVAPFSSSTTPCFTVPR